MTRQEYAIASTGIRRSVARLPQYAHLSDPPTQQLAVSEGNVAIQRAHVLPLPAVYSLSHLYVHKDAAHKGEG